MNIELVGQCGTAELEKLTTVLPCQFFKNLTDKTGAPVKIKNVSVGYDQTLVMLGLSNSRIHFSKTTKNQS